MSADQAGRLRLLVHDECHENGAAPVRAWRTLSIYGAKGGVGTTTLALNVAIALSVADCSVVLAARGDLKQEHVPRESGPAGLVVLNAERNWNAMLWGSRRVGKRILDEGAQVDWLIVDQGLFDAQSQCQETQALLVTTTEPAAMLAAFDALKLMKKREAWPEMVFNRVTESKEGMASAARMRAAATRLLGKPLPTPMLQEDAHVLAAARTGRAVTLTAPNCPFSRGVARLADRRISACPARAA